MQAPIQAQKENAFSQMIKREPAKADKDNRVIPGLKSSMADKGYRSVVFKSGQKMALRALYVVK